MKAVAVFPDRRAVEVIEQPEPHRSQPDDVLTRVLEVGVCGTDREICTFEYGTPPAGDRHLVIGHEALCQVVEVGPDVHTLRPGDLVVPSVRRPCPDPGCLACRAGSQDYCYTGNFTERGIKGAHGYMTEYAVDAAHDLHRVPRELRAVAVLTEPLTIAQKAVAQIFWLMQHRPPWIEPDTPPEQRGHAISALVLGIGPVGLLGTMTLVGAGCTTYVHSREVPPSPRSKLLDAIGATYVSSQTTSFEELAAQIGRIDLIYEAVGHTRFALDAMHVLGTNGIYVMTGVPGLQDIVQSDPARLMREMVLKNQVLLGTVNAGREDFRLALHDLEAFSIRWPAIVAALIAGRYAPEEAPDLVVNRPTGTKSVIAFDGGCAPI